MPDNPPPGKVGADRIMLRLVERVVNVTSMTITVVIIGSTGALGAAAADGFLARGARVFGLDRIAPEDAPTLHLQRQVHPAHTHADFHHLSADITDIESVHTAAARVIELAGGVDHVIQIAGGTLPPEVDQDDICAIDHHALAASVTLNLIAPMTVAQAFLPALRSSQAHASLTLTSSVNALSGIGLFAYSAAKAGLIALMRDLAVAEGPRGVRVNAIAPGTVVTPATEYLWSEHSDHFQRMADTTALAQLATPEDLADAYTALALDLHAVTGQTLVVDAGQTARWR